MERLIVALLHLYPCIFPPHEARPLFLSKSGLVTLEVRNPYFHAFILLNDSYPYRLTPVIIFLLSFFLFLHNG
jgi:hypothetical protein